MSPEVLSLQDLEAFVRALMAEGYSPRSVARMVAGVRGYYKHLLVSRVIASNPAEDLRPPRAWRDLPRYLSLEEVDALLGAPDLSTPRGLRDRALLDVLYATGLRVSELVSLAPIRPEPRRRFPDLHRQGRQAAHRAGGGRRHRVAADLPGRRPGGAAQGSQSSPWLFPGGRGTTALTRVGFWKLLKVYALKAGVTHDVSPHVLQALVRDASARSRRRPAGHPDDARTRRAVDDADLHARARGPPEARLRCASSAGVSAQAIGRSQPRPAQCVGDR